MITTTQNNIACDSANIAVQEAVKKAQELGIKINASVCDGAGIEMSFLRMTGAFIHSIDIARDKAYTAASFGFPTEDWPSVFKSAPELEDGIVRRDRLVTFGGGLPIKLDGNLVGAIGVSGGTAEEDVACAQAGLNAIG